MKKVSKNMSWEIVKKGFLPVLLFLFFLAGYVYYRTKIAPSLSPEVYQRLHKHVIAIFIASIAFIIQRIAGAVFAWYKETIADKTTTRLDDKLIPIFRRTFNVIIWVITLLIILPFYGVNISALIAALGVSSLAIALAAQDTIANIIAGFLIMVDTPFREGDKIKLPSGEIVKSLDIGVRRSKFMAEDGSIIIVPNLNLSKSKIVNFTYGEEAKR